jgi:enoyl-CoA hydratase
VVFSAVAAAFRGHRNRLSAIHDVNTIVLASTLDGVLTVTLNRPEKLNALSRDAIAALKETFEGHASDTSLRLVVLRGAGDKYFAAGGDLRDLGKFRDLDGARLLHDEGCAALDAVRRFPVPVIAALNGNAIGGGAELALACDLRIAAPHAKIGFIHGRLNISPAWGGGIDLMRVLGPAKALLAMAGAVLYDADEAMELGLVEERANDGETLDALIERFTAPLKKQAPQVMRAIKALAIAEREGKSRAEQLGDDREKFAVTWAHDDHWSIADKLLSK